MRGSVLALALAVGACATATPQYASQYSVAAYDIVLSLRFQPGRAGLLPTDQQSLARLGLELPETVVPDLYAAGPLAAVRVAAVDAALQRPVRWLQDGRSDPGRVVLSDPGRVVLSDPERVVLIVRTPPEIVADACRGPGVRLPGNIWPGSDDAAPLILPPGCAVANSIKVQVTSPGDLVRGRDLAPGAALPYAAAIERYYHRNDQAQAVTASSSAGDAGGAGLTSSSADPARAAAQNPLPGGLPPPPPTSQVGTPRP